MTGSVKNSAQKSFFPMDQAMIGLVVVLISIQVKILTAGCWHFPGEQMAPIAVLSHPACTGK